MLCHILLRKNCTDFGCGKDVFDRLRYLRTDSISFYECHRVFTLALRTMSVLSGLSLYDGAYLEVAVAESED